MPSSGATGDAHNRHTWKNAGATVDGDSAADGVLSGKEFSSHGLIDYGCEWRVGAVPIVK